MKLRRLIFLVVLAALCGGGVYAAFQAAQPAAAPLATYAPPGALLAIESPDFASLLHQWTSSPEQKRWLGSDDYAGFSRSRLFGRLAEAQDQFAATAGLAPNAKFLDQIAGSESLLVWYDIGNLEFLYITRMPGGLADKSPLFDLRSKFEERKAGDATFYVRTQQDTNRTIAFAAHGNYLLLATREDLLAGALDLMQKPTNRTLKNEAWYAGSVTAAARKPGDLRMTLNMARIVPSPYFRSYWVQQNITELKQYTAALSDLYREKNDFREERTLLPAHTDSLPAPADLSPVLAYVPTNSGVYRAVAQPSTEQVLGQFDEKLLIRATAAYRDRRIAPEADLTTPAAGSTSDLEQFIDEPFIAPDARSVALQQLAAAITRAQPSAMLVFSSGAPVEGETTDQIFAPAHAVIALEAAQPWSEPELQQALTSALGTTISVAGQGLNWSPQHNLQASWYELDGAYGLSLSVQGKTCIVATDRATLLQLLQAARAGSHPAQAATVVGGFSHASERAPFLHLTRLLDHSGAPTPGAQNNAPPFFSGNVASLSETFSDLVSETFVETSTAGATRQTIVYQWR